MTVETGKEKANPPSDELSPIDRIRSIGQPGDSRPDIGALKNIRQWKSLVLGKKDLGMNNFATIAEEKEEEISSDGSQGMNNGADVSSGTVVVTKKKITFAKPRKYIGSGVPEEKEEGLAKELISNPVSFVPLTSLSDESQNSVSDVRKTRFSKASGGSKSNASEAKQLPKVRKLKELFPPVQESIQNYAFSETPIEAQWNDAVSDGLSLPSWSKSNTEKINLSKQDLAQGSKTKQEEKNKLTESSKRRSAENGNKQTSKDGKKGSCQMKKTCKAKEETPSTSKSAKSAPGRRKQKTEKGKALNMKEVVHVYKNLAYGSKEEIKSFVENLSLVKDESKSESDKNLLSMMNLKALENKIKNFGKKSGKSQEPVPSKDKKTKSEKPNKRNRKGHIERLARHKVIKVPAAGGSNANRQGESTPKEKVSGQKAVGGPPKDKEPWKYVGMESALDKTYFVYPAYPPSVNLKKVTKTKKADAKGAEKPKKSEGTAAKGSERKTKVKKDVEVVVKQNLISRGGSRSPVPKVSGSVSNKSVSKPSATTVCTVEFLRAARPGAEEPEVGVAEESLLVYLHGTKALQVKSPYSDKQFSRVKFFRKEQREMPLIKGLGRGTAPKDRRTVSVKNVGLPERQPRVRSLDLIDFDEDIQNITEFLGGQEGLDRRAGSEEQEKIKKPEKGRWLAERPKKPELGARHKRRSLFESHHHPHHHQHHPHQHHPHHRQVISQENISPESIINEISKNIHHFQYLPDTEENRTMIGRFFDELDRQIEVSRKGTVGFQKLFSAPLARESFGPAPILGY